jgi:hypothetical protein
MHDRLHRTAHVIARGRRPPGLFLMLTPLASVNSISRASGDLITAK